MPTSTGGNAGLIRPGIFASHRGRKVRALLVLGVIASFSVLVVSNALNGSDKTASATDSTDQQYQVVQQAPAVQANPANPFDVVQNLTLPQGFVNQSAQTELFSLANEIAVAYATYSASESAQKFVQSVPAIDPIRADVLANAEASWPSIQKSGITVTATTNPSATPAVRAYDAEAGTVKVEVTVTQNVTGPDGTQSVQTRSVTMVLLMATKDAAKQNAAAEKPDYQNFPWVAVSLTSLG